jgi:hypothetical protein
MSCPGRPAEGASVRHIRKGESKLPDLLITQSHGICGANISLGKHQPVGCSLDDKFDAGRAW